MTADEGKGEEKMTKQDKDQIELMKADKDAAMAGETETLARIQQINEESQDALVEIRRLQQIVSNNHLRVAHLLQLRATVAKAQQ